MKQEREKKANGRSRRANSLKGSDWVGGTLKLKWVVLHVMQHYSVCAFIARTNATHV